MTLEGASDVAESVPLPASPRSSNISLNNHLDDSDSPDPQDDTSVPHGLTEAQQSNIHQLVEALLTAATALRDSLPRTRSPPHVDVEKQSGSEQTIQHNGGLSNIASCFQVVPATAEELEALKQTSPLSSEEIQAWDNAEFERFVKGMSRTR